MEAIKEDKNSVYLDTSASNHICKFFFFLKKSKWNITQQEWLNPHKVCWKGTTQKNITKLGVCYTLAQATICVTKYEEQYFDFTIVRQDSLPLV